MARPEPRAGREEEGFTLVEVLVALLIFAFVALGITGMFLYSVTVNASGFDYAVVASEGRRALEALQGLPYEHAALNATAAPVDIETRLPGYDVQKYYQILYTVTEYQMDDIGDVTGVWTPLAPGTAGNVKRISLTVEVDYPTGDPRFGGGRIGDRRMTVTGLSVVR